MTATITAFPGKYNYDSNQVEQFAKSYAEDLAAVDEERRPKTILIVEYYFNAEAEATYYEVHVGGADPEIHGLVGMLEMAKMRAINTTQTMVVEP